MESRLPTLLIAALFRASPALGGGCADPLTTSELDRLMDKAEVAFESADLPLFEDATRTLEASLPCVRDPLFPAEAARYHRVMGLARFTRQDLEGAALAFAAARAVEPDYVFPPELVAPGNPVMETYSSLKIRRGSRGGESLPTLVRGSWRVDGSEGQKRPRSRPTVLQGLDDKGAVQVSAWLTPQDTTPLVTWSPIAVEQAPPVPHLPLVLASGGGLLASGGLYWAARVTSDRYWDPATPYEDLASLRSRTNALVVTSGLVAVASLGVGGTALWSARW